MPKFLLIALCLISAGFTFGQTQRVSFAVDAKGFDCNSFQKKAELSYVQDGEDTLILQTLFSTCNTALEIPRLKGTYHLVIRTEKLEDIRIAFEITDNSPENVDLGTFEFKKRTKQLDEVTISGVKRSFIQVDADKTTITVKDNPILTTSSIYDAILKIPGIVPYPGGGFTVGGKSASVFFEGVPGNLSGDDLINLLKSLPATSVEKIEIISNPGASYDANVSGAIINVITLAKVNKWISGTVTMNYGLNQNNKILPSLVLSGRSKKLSWQLQTGYSYFERSNHNISSRNFTTFDPLVTLKSERNEKNISEFYYFKPSVNFKLSKRTTILLNYNGSFTNGNNSGNNISSSSGITPAVNLVNDYRLKSKGLNNELIAKYRTNLDTLKRVFSVTAYYSDYSRDQLTKSVQTLDNENQYSLLNYGIRLRNVYLKSDIEIPFEKHNFYLQAGVKYRRLFADSRGDYNLQNETDEIFQHPTYNSRLDFDYVEDNLAGYIEMKKGFGKKFSVGGGLRAENFNLDRKSTVTLQKRNNYFNFFPAVNAIYRFSPDMNMIATYSRKISIPSYNQFDPNNSGYYDNYNTAAGNILLSPNFYDNMELKFSIFEYLQLSMNYSHSKTLNLFEITAEPNSIQTVQTFRTYEDVNVLSYFMSLPVPFGIFKEGMNFFNKAIDIDKISFLYLYAGRTKTMISGMEYINPNRARWNYGVYSQFILPLDIRMNIDYYIGTKGTYQIYDFTRPISSLEVIFTKSFLNKKLKASLAFEDIFNTSQSTIQTAYQNVNLQNYSKDDTRIIWMKLSYSFGRFEKNDNDLPDFNKGGQNSGPENGLR